MLLSTTLHLLLCTAEVLQLLCFCLHLSLSPVLPVTRTCSPALYCREAADAEQHASQLATSAASALQSARSVAALLTGRQGEVEPTDLEDLAASRLDAWLNEHSGADSFQASGSLASGALAELTAMQFPTQSKILLNRAHWTLVARHRQPALLQSCMHAERCQM